MSKSHILELPSWFYPMGGQFTITQGKALQNKEFKVTVLANVILPWSGYGFHFKDYPWRLIQTEMENIRVYVYYFRKIPKIREYNINLWIKKYMALFEKYISIEGQPDIIHTHSSIFAGYVAHLIKEKYGIPYVLTEHWDAFSLKSDYSRSLFDDFTVKHIQKAIYNADSIIAVSDEIIPGIKQYADKHTPITSISNIVDTEFYHVPKTKPKNERFLFVCTNDFKEMKGYDTLIEAVNLLKDQGANFDVRIAGADFDTTECLVAFSKSRYPETFSFTGDLDSQRVRQLLWQADAFCLPSRSESQSISTLEALSTGLPIICTDVVPEKIRISEVGYTVPIESPVEFGEAMGRMLLNYKTFNPKYNSEHVKSIASSDVVGEQLYNVFKQVLKNSN
ncbi:MAG: glycosyltransferase family 4 protein [Bacteroidales bacterium]